MCQKPSFASTSFVIDYTPTTLQKCGMPICDKPLEINNWPHCVCVWGGAQLGHQAFPTP